MRATSIPSDPISRVIATNGIKPPLPPGFELDSVDGGPGEPQLNEVRFGGGRVPGKRPPGSRRVGCKATSGPAGRPGAAERLFLLAFEQQPDQRYELFFLLGEKMIGREHHGLARAAHAL